MSENQCTKNEHEKNVSVKKEYDKENECIGSTKPTLKSERESHREALTNRSLTARDHSGKN